MNKNYILGLALFFTGALISINASEPDSTAHNVEIEGKQNLDFGGDRLCDPTYRITMFLNASWEEGTIGFLKTELYECICSRAGFAFSIEELVLLSYSEEANVLRELADSELVSTVSKNLVVYCATNEEGDIIDLPKKFRRARIISLPDDVCVGAACARAI